MSLLERRGLSPNGSESPGTGEVRGEGDGQAAKPPPDPELAERAQRRRFTAEYKLRILAEADEAVTRPGELGALLRREGLYSSNLTKWRRQREEGALEGLSRSRGRKPAEPLEKENALLRRRLERAEAELEKAHRVIEVQGNVSALLGELLGPRGAEEPESSE
jgi:transposase